MRPAFTTLACLLIFTIAIQAGNGNKKNITSNEEVVYSTFEILSMHISRDGMLHWTSLSEKGKLDYYVEQYIFDRWVRVGTVQGIGTPEANSYSFPIVFHNGDNKFRVRQRGSDEVSRYSQAIEVTKKVADVTFELIDKNQRLSFSRETFYMIYDPYGRIIDRGYALNLDISEYEKGRYCLVFDNKYDFFIKKKVLFKNTPLALAL